MTEGIYDRSAAVEYSKVWALKRNPRYGDFESMGGDCTNFISQCLYAGSGVMNYTPVTGWYYNSLQSRAPAWTGTVYLWNFLTGNQGYGPYGKEAPLELLKPGDIIQMQIDQPQFHHTVIVQKIIGKELFAAAHSFDANLKPVSSYLWKKLRAVQILGVRKE